MDYVKIVPNMKELKVMVRNVDQIHVPTDKSCYQMVYVNNVHQENL